MCNMRCKSAMEMSHSSCASACEKGAIDGCISLADAVEMNDSDCATLLRYRANDLRGEARYEYVRAVCNL
jgi:hypothetical protein